jgi:hypothetical protein
VQASPSCVWRIVRISIECNDLNYVLLELCV